MEFKGTKGYWTLKHSESKDAWNVIGTKLGGKYKICRSEYNEFDEKETKANMQLVSCAPEMLGILRSLINDKECFSDICSHGYGEELEFVISKATTI